MNRESIRLSTLAEIKVLSLQSLINFTEGEDNAARSETAESVTEEAVLGYVDTLKSKLSADNITLSLQTVLRQTPTLFKTVGIARSVRITEDYGTTQVFGLGNPLRPRLVPNNLSVSVTCERLQLDRRNLYDFMTSPEYFYSTKIQRQTGILDAVYYTYMFLKNKEAGVEKVQIYALMPRNTASAVTNGDVVLVNNIDMVGFKLSHAATLGELLNLDTFDDITEGFDIREGNDAPSQPIA